MKNLLIVLLGSILLLNGYVSKPNEEQKKLHSATCYGEKTCYACKNCKYCMHCNSGGGNCGVCSSNSSKPLKSPSEKQRTVKPAVGATSSSSQCKGTTKKGTRCKRRVKGGGYCWQHK